MKERGKGVRKHNERRKGLEGGEEEEESPFHTKFRKKSN